MIGADQILVCDGVWFDKPADVAAAREQLRALRGRRHVLVTAVVCHRGGGRVWHHVASPRLAMRDFSDEFLERLSGGRSGSVTSTVGPTGWKPGVQLFDAIEGALAILGLPLWRCCQFLRRKHLLVK